MTIFEGKRALLDGFRRGDHSALADVYRFYVDSVTSLVRLGFGLSTGGRVQGVAGLDAQRDLVQETFARAFSENARSAYDGLQPYRPYLMRIAKNLLVDRLRRSGREDLVATLPNDDEPAPGAVVAEHPESAEERLAWEPLRRATAEYLGSLDPSLREFVQLRFEEEASQYEVAEKLGLTRRKVRTLEDRIREGLRAHLRSLRLL